VREKSMRIEARQGFSITVTAALLVVGGSCSLSRGKGVAESAVAQFHNQYNAGQFREIYAQTDEGFRESASEADFLSLLEALRRKLGAVVKAEQAGWRVNATPLGTVVTLSYSVEFSEGRGAEQFVFRVSGDKARLYNYNVNSPLLITK
jgi:hypothetical protein